jgi:hypothetical protein
MRSAAILLALLAAIPVCHFASHYASRSPRGDRLRYAVRHFLGQQAAAAELARSGKRYVASGPATAAEADAFLKARPNCCQFKSREEVGATDDGLPFLWDPFGSYVAVSDGRKSLIIYVPGNISRK